MILDARDENMARRNIAYGKNAAVSSKVLAKTLKSERW